LNFLSVDVTMNFVLRFPIRIPSRFFVPLLAVLLISVGSFLSLGLISDQKLRYALFQRDLLALVSRWDGLVRATALLPVSGYNAPTAYKDGGGSSTVGTDGSRA
jgi:hypothetical protein